MLKGKLKYILCIVWLPVFCYGQIPDSTTIIYGWKLENYTIPVQSEVDTLLPKLHNHNPIYKYSISNSYLGNLGSPVTQNTLKDRFFDDEFFVISAFRPYLATYNDLTFINTTKPFSHLFYTNAGSRRDKEESIDVFYARNVNQNFGIGLKYNLFAAKGQYLYQDVKKNSFSLFSSFTNQKYNMHAGVNYNQYKTSESGGVLDSLYRFGDFRFNKEIPVWFEGSGEPKYNPFVSNKIRYIDFILSNRLKFTRKTASDSSNVQRSVIGEPVLSYVIRGRRASKIYEDLSPITNLYYDTIFSNGVETYDSVSNFDIVNSLAFEFKTTINNKVDIGIYSGINYEYRNLGWYTGVDSTAFPIPEDTVKLPLVADSIRTFNKNHYEHNLYYAGGFYGNLFGAVKTSVDAKLYFLGPKAGQSMLNGITQAGFKIFNYPLAFNIEGNFKNNVPSYLLENYYSNHIEWHKEFESVQKVNLSASIAAPSNFFRIYADYDLIRNAIYFSEDIQPKQYNNALSIISWGLEKEFVFWKIHSMNKMVNHLFIENENIIQVPKLVVFNSTYVDHNWHFDLTGGDLRTMLGFDIYYHTEFNGYKYDPITSTFIQQMGQKVGNYPYVDVYLNVKIKQARGFIKVENVSSELFEDDDYYSAVYYPRNNMTMKFGVAWTFYN